MLSNSMEQIRLIITRLRLRLERFRFRFNYRKMREKKTVRSSTIFTSHSISFSVLAMLKFADGWKLIFSYDDNASTNGTEKTSFPRRFPFIVKIKQLRSDSFQSFNLWQGEDDIAQSLELLRATGKLNNENARIMPRITMTLTQCIKFSFLRSDGEAAKK